MVVLLPTSSPRITNHLYDLRNGMSLPQVCECSDGTDRVVKLQGLCALSSLASDWVGSLLAVRLEILTPAPELCIVDEAAVATMPTSIRSKCKSGLALGTTYITPSVNVVGLHGIIACGNHQDLLSRLLALDSWIGTEDRMRPDFGRNLLVDREDGRSRLMAIDFGMAFPGVVNPLFGAGNGVPPVDAVCHDGVRLLLDNTAMQAALAEIEGMSEGEIVKIVRLIPEQWATDEAKGKMVQFLIRRRPDLRSCVERYIGV